MLPNFKYLHFLALVIILLHCNRRVHIVAICVQHCICHSNGIAICIKTIFLRCWWRATTPSDRQSAAAGECENTEWAFVHKIRMKEMGMCEIDFNCRLSKAKLTINWLQLLLISCIMANHFNSEMYLFHVLIWNPKNPAESWKSQVKHRRQLHKSWTFKGQEFTFHFQTYSSKNPKSANLISMK